MAALPSYVDLLADDFGLEPDPSVDRIEMERGPPKQAVRNSQVLVAMSVTLLFKSKADAVSFEAWWMDTIGRVGAFDIAHPLTGATVSVSFKGGAIGQLKPRSRAFNAFQRSAVLEYLR